MSENKLSSEDTLELGSSGLVRYGGFVFEEFLRELQGPRGMAVYREMLDNDPTIGSIMFAVDLLCRKVSFRADAASDSAEDIAAAEFLKSNMEDMSATWTDTISEILTMIPFGFSWHEEVLKFRRGPHPGIDPETNRSYANSRYDDGLLGWRRLPIRAQETLWQWEFGPQGSIQAMVQRAAPQFNTVAIPIERSLLFRHRAHKNNPEGKSALRNAYRPWYFKKKLEVIEAIGIERDLTGLPVAWVPADCLKADATPAKKMQLEQFKTIVKNIRNDEQGGIVMPLAYDTDGKNKLFDLTLLTTAGKRSFDTNAVIGRYDAKIAQTFLADLVLIGNNGRGSYAMMEAKVDLFTQAVEGWLDSIVEIFNRNAIPRLFDRNGFKLKQYPKLSHGTVDAPDLKELGNFVSSLSGGESIIRPTQADEDYLREAAHMPTAGSSSIDLTVGKSDEQANIERHIRNIFAGYKHR